VHRYNYAFKNERSVEVPLVWEIIKVYRGKRILEIGNVLSRYFPVSHDVIDKYEKASGVLNEDILDFHPPCRHDLIVNISTIEHIGYDESPREPERVARAFMHINTFLAPCGVLVVTFPLGYNPYLDELWRRNKLLFTERYALKRVSWYNLWKQVPADFPETPAYDKPYSFANWLAIGILQAF